jgi:hypothetical protein
MREIRRNLGALEDPESKSLCAVMNAAQLARAWGAEPELFHGVATTGKSFLSLQCCALAQAWHRRIVPAKYDLPVDEAIVRRARRVKADLIDAECHAVQCAAPGPPVLPDAKLLQKNMLPILLVKAPDRIATQSCWRRSTLLLPSPSPRAFMRRFCATARGSGRALRGTLHTVRAKLPQLRLAGSGVHVIAIAASLA